MTKVVYTAPIPNYVVEESEPEGRYYSGDMYYSVWSPYQGFDLEYDARKYANKMKALYPGNKYRVVSHVET